MNKYQTKNGLIGKGGWAREEGSDVVWKRSAPVWLAVGVISNGERVPKLSDKVQLERQWWVWKWYGWAKEVVRVIPEGKSVSVAILVAAEEEVLECMGILAI